MNHNFRQRAREHVQTAKALLAKSEESVARYACLEVRMAIEALTYQILEVYLSEVSNNVMVQWTPKKVMEELLAVDPRADKSMQIFVGIEEVPGVESKDMKYLGEDKRFTIKWGSKAHNALGSFLHEPTIADLQKSKDKSDQAARAKAQEIIAELDKILESGLFNVNFGNFTSFACDCGFTIRRKVEALDPQTPIICGACGRRYLYRSNAESQSYAFLPDRASYICESCHEEAFVDAHELEKLQVVVCHCGAKAQLIKQYALTKIAPETT